MNYLINTQFTEKIFCTIIVLFTSFFSIYFYNISLAPFPMFAFLILAFILLLFNKKLNKHIIFIGLLFIILFSISGLIGKFFEFNVFYFNSILGSIIGPLFFILFYSLYYQKINYVEYALRKVIIFHLFFFIIQTITFYLTGNLINFLQYITGEESRNIAYGLLTGLIRPSGLFNEPASYVTFIGPSLLFLILYNKKLGLFELITLGSILLTLSASGVIISIYILAIYFIIVAKKRARKIFFSYLMILFLALTLLNLELIELIYKSFSQRFILNPEIDGSVSMRFVDGFKLFFSSPFYIQLFGFGIGNYSPLASTVASGFMAIIVHLGYLFTLIFLIINIFSFRLMKVDLKYFLIFSFFLFKIITYLFIHYWLFLALIFFISKNNNTNTIKK